MEYKDWLMLTFLAKEQNLTKTAERLFISQPALSYRLQNIEKELEVKIVNRYSNGVVLTQQGEYLVQYSIEMIERFATLKAKLQSMNKDISGLIRIGFSSVLAKYKMAQIVKNYRLQFPSINLHVETASSTLKLPEMLKNNQIDIAIIRGDPDWAEGKKLLSEEPMYLVFHKSITLQELSEYTWIEYEPSYITKSHEQKLAWWHEKIARPLPCIIKSDSIEACMQMVSCGLGWCIVPKIHTVKYRSLFCSPVVWPNGNTMSWRTYMLYSNSIEDDPLYKTFINYVQRKYPQ